MTDIGAGIRGPLLTSGGRRLDTLFGVFELAEFRNLETHRSCFALVRGDLSGDAPVLARVHSSCVTSEFFGACDCDCAAQLDAALEAIAAEERGVLFYLGQEGRGAGLTAKARDRMLVQASSERLSTFEAYDRLGLAPDQRRYDEVATMCRMLGIEAPLELLTNNPDKVSLIEREKVRVSATRPLQRATSPFNRHYLQAKQRSGHALHGLEGEGTRAEWPESVRWFDPAPLRGRSDILYSASYWLPVRSDAAGQSLWFRLHLYYDLKSPAGVGAERVVLSYGPESAESPYLLRVQTQHLFDRFPLRAELARPSWRRTARAIAEHGGGCAVFLPDGLSEGVDEPLDSASVALLAEHAKGRHCRLVSDANSSALDRAASDGLSRLGVELGPAVRLAE